MASTGGPIDNLEHGGSAVDPLQALTERLSVVASVNFSSSCHALSDGPFSRTQATTNAPAQQILLNSVETRRMERVSCVASKLGVDPMQRLQAPGDIDWADTGLDAQDVRCLAGLCIRQPAATQAFNIRLPGSQRGGWIPLQQLLVANHADLRNRRIGNLGVIFLTVALRFNAGSLTSCDLRGNSLGEEGWCAIFDALRDNLQHRITNWELAGQGITPVITKSLAAYMAVSTSLTSVRVPPELQPMVPC